MKRVVIVDDSRAIRFWLRHILNNDTRLEVVGEAADAQEARAVLSDMNPDVVTLDINMPGMNGIEFLDRLMRSNPLPVVVVSSSAQQGSDIAVRALSSGAVDCVPKPNLDGINLAKRDIVRKVFSAACSQVQDRRIPAASTTAHQAFAPMGPTQIVLIGASTGGVVALEHVLQALNPLGPPVMIVQHMPAEFLISFSQMLNRKLVQDVGLLCDHETLLPGHIRFAPALGRSHSEVSQQHGAWVGTIVAAQTHSQHYPSVETLFLSGCHAAQDVIAVILTGLGSDGADAMKSLRNAGARTIGQDQQTSVVYGMPRAAFERGAVERQLPLEQIGQEINALAQAYRSGQVKQHD